MGMSAVATADARDLRGAMVDVLKKRGVQLRPRIEEAFRSVPREAFLPGVGLDRVYSGDAIVTKQDDDGRPMSSSSEVGIMIDMAELLDVAPGHRILEIGAGTGYNAAVLAELAGDRGAVTTVDLDPEIAAQARQNLAAAAFHRVAVIAGDGWAGTADRVSYDRVEVTAGVSDLSPTWVAQLADGGTIVFPFVLPAGMQTVMALQKQGTDLVSTGLTPGAFMRLRGQGGALPRTRTVDALDIELSDALVGVASETIAALLRGSPRFVVAPPLGWEALTLLALFEGNISASKRGRIGLAVGVLDPAGSLALVDLARDSVAGAISIVVSFGSDVAQSRLFDAIEHVRAVRLRDLHVVARPTRLPAPSGEVVVRRPEFTFAFARKRSG
jgi:protein-L-isoaspartate(D-aspartate) O-methyltransferase